MAILCGVLAAVAYGVSDFLGGLGSRRVHFLWVSFAAAVVSTAMTALLVLVVPALRPDTGAAPLLWGALAGLGSAAGILALYRGYAEGQVTVVGPLSAVGAAALPALVGVATGERLAPLAVAGIVVAVPAVALMAHQTADSPGDSPAEVRAAGPEHRPRRLGPGIAEGIVSGAGFALLFVALGRAGDAAGLWPVLADQLVALALLGLAVAAGWLGRPRRPGLGGRSGRVARWQAVGAGALGLAATVAFFAATHLGSLAVAAVLTALYPGFTVVLAILVLRERPDRWQVGGLVLGALAVVAIAAG
ncbi:drug/metabolite transporter (DMT)-like permease [Friedmanniella endophytica]|uniref:Drug/metabolite transporter (DMT)-like permease n=1 Tax=Microlunatus kandeliicorticis TaxID=1759536 RepID=A0A7W3IPY1_9ACTN|nr:EamA family transporter [Microlunatus kandeliicorticis]MBA8793076.1 drug/metabolite transporter (DMT)-like permease [Microlunatus kandeliicorticis]